MNAPVFMVGSVRSGTTLLRLMLDHHPSIAFNLESDYLVRKVSERGEFPDSTDYRAWLRENRVFRHSEFTIDERLDFQGLVNDFLEQKRRRDGKAIVGATVHVDFRKLRWIWPQARYIHLVRDGRDVASSVMRMGWAGNLYVAGDFWLRAEREWDELSPLLPEGTALDMRYEQLVENPRAELKRVCAFLRVDFDERMFDYASKTSYERPDASLNHQWKSRMHPSDVRLLESKLGPQLVRRGYELSGQPALALSDARRRWLNFHSRLGMFRFRTRRYGARLTLQETLSRRLSLRALHERTMHEMDEITDANLK